jgi:hypothetical protein
MIGIKGSNPSGEPNIRDQQKVSNWFLLEVWQFVPLECPQIMAARIIMIDSRY